MNITNVQEGATCSVVSVNQNEKMQKYLKTLGILEKANITLISKTGGNYILNVKDGRYAIDTKLASSIEVVSEGGAV